jgi:cytochrome P450
MAEPPTLDEQLEGLIDALDPAAVANPYPVWKRLREEAPVHRSGSRIVVTRYPDVKALLHDESRRYHQKLSESVFAAQHAASAQSELGRAFRELNRFQGLWLAAASGEEHERFRRIVHRGFTPRRIAELKESMRSHVDELLSSVEDGVVDLQPLAYQLPMRVILDLLDCPQEDLERIFRWTVQLGSGLNRADADAIMGAYHAMVAFRDYVIDRIEESRTAANSTGLIATMLDASASERLTEDELIGTFAFLLFAGHETTAGLIGQGLHALLIDREQWELLCVNPDLWPNAIEELVRFVSPAQYTVRIARGAHDLGTVEVDPGEILMPIIAAANRDPEVFEDPDRLDIRRENVKAHLGFGFGPKYCLGNAVARLEASVVLGELARRFPEMCPAGDDLRYVRRLPVRLLAELPVVLGPAGE